MGHKVNPLGFRIGQGKTWISRWFAKDKKDYRERLLEDVKLRQALMERLKLAGIVQVEIERSIKSITIVLHVSRPGVVIGRGGTGLEELKAFVAQKLGIGEGNKTAPKVDIKIEEVKNPELSAQLIAMRLAEQLARRMPYRRVVTRTIERVMAAGARGVKIVLSGRIAGAEISRRERYSQGKVPLQTIRADIDYAQVPALTKSGYIGVKVWIYAPTKKI